MTMLADTFDFLTESWYWFVLVAFFGFLVSLFIKSGVIRLLSAAILIPLLLLGFMAAQYGIFVLGVCIQSYCGFYALSAAGIWLGHVMRKHYELRAQTSPGGFSFLKSPSRPAKEPGLADGRLCVACCAPLRFGEEFCRACGWTQLTD